MADASSRIATKVASRSASTYRVVGFVGQRARAGRPRRLPDLVSWPADFGVTAARPARAVQHRRQRREPATIAAGRAGAQGHGSRRRHRREVTAPRPCLIDGSADRRAGPPARRGAAPSDRGDGPASRDSPPGRRPDRRRVRRTAATSRQPHLRRPGYAAPSAGAPWRAGSRPGVAPCPRDGPGGDPSQAR